MDPSTHRQQVLFLYLEHSNLDGRVVAWTREEDMRNDPFRPGSTIRFRGTVDGGGRLRALHARVAGPPLGVHEGAGRRGGSGEQGDSGAAAARGR